MEQRIKSVEKGYGQESIFFMVSKNTTDSWKVDEIKEEGKQISSDCMINIFRGYKDGKLVFEMGCSIDVTVTYFTD
jgi:hypothetical protein